MGSSSHSTRRYGATLRRFRMHRAPSGLDSVPFETATVGGTFHAMHIGNPSAVLSRDASFNLASKPTASPDSASGDTDNSDARRAAWPRRRDRSSLAEATAR